MKTLVLLSAILFSNIPDDVCLESSTCKQDNPCQKIALTFSSGIGQQTCPEDVDGDRVVTNADLNRVSARLGTTCTCREDVNGDGSINAGDYQQVYQNLGRHC